MREYEMFPMVKEYFETLGYKVNAEVKSCDVTAIKDKELIIVEMKTSLNLTVVYQALERKKITPNVYIAVPKPKKSFNKSINKMKNLLSKLQIGLLIIDVVNKACVSYGEPSVDKSQRINSKKKAKIVKEIDMREVDNNLGGINKTKILTAYKEKGIAICVILENEKIVTTKILREKYGFDKDIAQYLRTNFYLWFVKSDRATYVLSPRGEAILNSSEFSNAIKYFRKKYKFIK